ncbi:MAG: SDR family oxidoreductase [Chloroflexi bacterium]|nr:SDR family oxidoreductase [Chloroflexota bacterium]
MAKLTGKVAFITGAGSGIGRASALRFHEEGAAVVCADVDIDGAKDTAARIAEHGGKANAIRLDVTDSAAVKQALEDTVVDFGGLHVLFNNAGVGGRDLGWDTVIRINLDGVYHGLFHGAALMAARGGGCIINTASVAGLVGLVRPPVEPEPPIEWGAGAYMAAKHGVAGLTKQFALTYAPKGVRVNAIAPGYIHTPMTASVREDPATEAFITSLHPLGRLGQPEEIAAAAAFLASDDASFITGVILPVDGGYTAR